MTYNEETFQGFKNLKLKTLLHDSILQINLWPVLTMDLS